MKLTLIVFSVSVFIFHDAPYYDYGCSITNEKKIQVGSYPGVKGVCSNNGLTITCILMEGTGVECDGPSGGYTGYNLNTLIFSACGCSAQEERERRLKEEFEKNKDRESVPGG